MPGDSSASGGQYLVHSQLLSLGYYAANCSRGEEVVVEELYRNQAF